MTDDINNKPLTIKDVQEVLIPAMQEVFTTKKDLEILRTEFKNDMKNLRVEFKNDMTEKIDNMRTELKDEIREKFDKLMRNDDKILKDLETLMTEKAMSYHQKKKERQFWGIIVDALRESKILSADQLAKINELEVF